MRTWIHDNLCYVTINCDTGQHSQFLRCFSDICYSLGIVELHPVTAFLSSIGYVDNNADKCIDGITDGPDSHNSQGDLCHTNHETAPWLALDYGDGARMFIEKVVIVNRKNCCWDRTKNVKIWLSDELPTSGSSMFTGGELLGTFAGPGGAGEQIEIESGPGWAEKYGRYVILQLNLAPGRGPINLKEVTAFGVEGDKIHLAHQPTFKNAQARGSFPQ